MNKRIAFFVICLFMLSISYAQAAAGGTTCFNMFDEQGQLVYQTGWKVNVGDQFLTADNKRYEVMSVAGTTVQAKYLETINLAGIFPGHASIWAWLQPSIVHAQGGKVAIYHTHSDESYVPTDGKDSIYGAGGIYKVGDAFAQALQTDGMEVIHSDARHDPHDDMAYERSRRTVIDLLKQQPDAVFDVHRDSAPPEVYKATIDGQDVSKVQLVVGKYGPTGKQIEDYALQLKSVADNQHPGLVKGIFFAKGGDYNQDLHPRSMLVEVGSQANDRTSAEHGIALFADVLPTVLGKSGANGVSGASGMGTATTGMSGSMKSMGILIGLLIMGVVAFLFISTGSLKEAGSKLKQFTTTEFTNLFASKSDRDKDKNKENKNGE
jgi:stage II sporulation protein P